ncbi:hypothetical protein M758_11G112900 [Ceratodon purpureus]|nr:hypothetical protein M758_11G112900 [Ceratodon purpureus]
MEAFAEAPFADWVDDDSMLAMMAEVEKSQQEVEVKVEDAQEPECSLSSEQQRVVDLVREGKNVFFTGSGGTGKTRVLKRILKFLGERYQGLNGVVITAPTGIAAIPIGGSTIHSATGIGIPRRRSDFRKMWERRNRQKWRWAKVWIIDEISMVSAEMLQYLEQTIRRIRTLKEDLPGEPFGGLQVIFAGDFFQLQPVPDKNTYTDVDQFLNSGLAFEATAWHRANLETVILGTVFRQEDGDFVRMLNGIRTGENPAALDVIVKRCARELPKVDRIKPTVLFSTNNAADKENLRELNALPGEVKSLVAVDKKIPDETEDGDPDVFRKQYNRLKWADFWTQCLALEEINLKVGAQVMLLRNLELLGKKSDLVNGSRGVVVGWKSKEDKLKELELDKTRPRYCDLDEIKPTSAYKRLKSSSIEFIPIVEFRNGRTIDCIPELFDYPILNVGECQRLQVPLMLAWALTIHKCQGMTLDYLIVNLENIFAVGQLYVALSRVRSMDGLRVKGDAAHSYVMVCPKVVEFYKALARKDAHLIAQLPFPDLVLDFPDAEIVEPFRKKTRPDKLFEKVPEKVFSEKNLLPVICYKCKKEGHPISACRSEKVPRIN